MLFFFIMLIVVFLTVLQMMRVRDSRRCQQAPAAARNEPPLSDAVLRFAEGEHVRQVRCLCGLVYLPFHLRAGPPGCYSGGPRTGGPIIAALRPPDCSARISPTRVRGAAAADDVRRACGAAAGALGHTLLVHAGAAQHALKMCCWHAPLTIRPKSPSPTAQLLSYLIVPLHQTYADAGDFTVAAKLKTSLRENALLYSAVGISAAGGLFILIVTEGVNPQSLKGMAIALSQCFSLSCAILLMGFGFVEIPRSCWRKAGLTARLNWCKHRVGRISAKLDAAHMELAKMVWFAEQVSSTMPRRHQLRWAVELIDESVKESAVCGQAPETEASAAAEEDYDFEDIHVTSPPTLPSLSAPRTAPRSLCSDLEWSLIPSWLERRRLRFCGGG